MMEFINNSRNWIINHFSKDKVNRFSIVVIMVYYYVGLLSYITVPIKPVYRLFTSGSSVAVVVRALMTAMMVLYCLLVVIVNKEKIQWKWAIVFTYILLFTLLSTAISPQTYNYIYESESNYGTVYWVQVSTGLNRLFTMYLSSISDYALAFCFLFILPIVINNRKQVLSLTLLIVVIGLLECGYSIIRERGEYIKLINMVDPQYSGYNINIGATFGNKEDWGAFATVAFCSTLASLFCLNAKGWKSLLLRVSLIIAAIIIFAFSIASLCKTAIGAESFCLIIVLIGLVFMFYRENKVLFVAYLVLLSVLFLCVFIFLTVPSFHSEGILGKIYKVVNSYIISPVTGGAAAGRSAIWMRFVNNLRTYNLFFGLSKAGVSTYSQVITVEGQSTIHNGIAYFFGSYGLLGISIYFVLIAIVLHRIIKLGFIDLEKSFLLGALFVSALVFSLSESEVLIVSSSNPIYIFNILLCSFSEGYWKKEKEQKKGLCLCV